MVGEEGEVEDGKAGDAEERNRVQFQYEQAQVSQQAENKGTKKRRCQLMHGIFEWLRVIRIQGGEYCCLCINFVAGVATDCSVSVSVSVLVPGDGEFVTIAMHEYYQVGGLD